MMVKPREEEEQTGENVEVTEDVNSYNLVERLNVNNMMNTYNFP